MERIKHWDTTKLSEKAASNVAWLDQFLSEMKKTKPNDIKQKTKDIESMTRTLEELELIEEELQGRDPRYVLTRRSMAREVKGFHLSFNLFESETINRVIIY